MRRILPLILTTSLLAACGSSDSTATTGGTATTGAPSTTALVSGSDAPTADSAAPTTLAPPPTSIELAEASAPDGCEAPTTTTATTVAPVAAPTEQPEIDLPKETPTKLTVTEIEEGSGEAAQPGDILSVYYTGVFSTDGTQFDSNIGRDAFDFPLGQQQVIQGWDKGLVGAKVGSVRQLDVPSDLAYGPTGSPPQIPADTPLTFVVYVVGITPAPPAVDPADSPTYELTETPGPGEFRTETIVEGDKCDFAQVGDRVFVNVKLVRGDTLAVLEDSWQNGQALGLTIDTQIWPGLAQGLVGMGRGELRLIEIPAPWALGADGNVANQLEPDTVLLALVEFVGRP